MSGLLPRKRGPKDAHKCTEAIIAFVAARREETPARSAKELAVEVGNKFGVQLHPRTLERHLSRLEKKRRGRIPRPRDNCVFGDRRTLRELKAGRRERPALRFYELAVLLHQGVPGWLTFMEQQAEARQVASWSEADNSLSFQVVSTTSVPRRPEVVCILASVVSHCLGGVA